ncbi:MAG: DNA replication/repair protein RecF [Clostridia bacterium]|nr:DNA replication/repair protein RecF [Clostridia bacterium]
MKCSEIDLTNFRNIESEKVSFSDGINVLWGKNAQGKSNVLEAVYYFARGRSFRSAKDREMIRFGADFARIAATCRKSGAERDAEFEIVIPKDEGLKKKVFRNGAPISGMGELIGSFRAVLFCPAHLSLVNGPPHDRRAFLDIAISQLSKEYMDRLSEYRRLLLQRNAALKAAAKGESVPRELWETFAEQMAAASSRIASYRYDYMSMLSFRMLKHFNAMTGGGEVPSLSFVSDSIPKKPSQRGVASDDDEDKGEIEAEMTEGFGKTNIDPSHLADKLMSDLEREIKHGSTVWGPHKDDIRIKLNGKDAKIFASQGQMRSLALTMKLSEGELSYSIGGEKPVILLDDVLSELDGERRRFVLGSLKDRQIIVTSCEPSLFDSAEGEVNLLHVEAGHVTQM